MWIQLRRYSAIVLVAISVVWTVDRAWSTGFILGQTKEELKLMYDVAVLDHGTGRITVVLTLADEGRLKPLDDVQLAIPGEDTNDDGSHWMDLVVSIEMHKADDGKRVGRTHILKELAKRAEIRFNTHTMDGTMDPLTRLHYVVPIAKHLADASNAAPVAKPDPEVAAPPATEQKKD
jgi:hypothetical protein